MMAQEKKPKGLRTQGHRLEIDFFFPSCDDFTHPCSRLIPHTQEGCWDKYPVKKAGTGILVLVI